MATNIVTTITTTMRNLFCFFSERRGRYKRRSECEFPSDTKEHPSEKNTPSERERIDDVNVNVDEEEEEDKEEEEEELCIFFESRACAVAIFGKTRREKEKRFRRRTSSS